MFGLLNTTQIYGLQQDTTTVDNTSSLTNPITNTNSKVINNNNNNNSSSKNHRQLNKVTRNSGGGGGGGGGGLGGGLAHHLQGMKVPANFIEKLIKSELLTGYEAVKHFKNFHHSSRHHHHHHHPLHNSGSNLKTIDCDNLHGNYRSGNFAYEDINSQPEMTVIKFPNDTQHQDHHQVPAADMAVIDSTTTTTTTTSATVTGSSIFRPDSISILQREDSVNGNSKEMISDHSSSTKSNDPSSSSPADSPETERKPSPTVSANTDRVQRRKLLQMITFLDQQNQRLQKELAREKRRRTEELSRIIKSLICMESKLKIDKKQINQRLLEKDTEICRLVSVNRALRKKLHVDKENDVSSLKTAEEAECLTLEALQCISCKQNFYAIESKESWTQTSKDGRKANDEPTTEHGSSSDDTVSSSFYGARRSVRYTSKRTFGTFRDYMRSRSMNIDDPNLDNSEENASTISRDDSQNSYEKMNIYSRTIDRLHGVRRVSSIEGDLDSEYDNSSLRKNQSHSSGIEEDDLLMSPTEEDRVFSPKDEKMISPCNSKGNSLTRSKDFSEVSPKQEFETSTDDWYASASEGEEESESVRTKSYGYNVGVNPVLECVNQILLQQSMEESMNDSPPTSLEGHNNQNLNSSQRGGRQSRSSSNGSAKDQGNVGTISRKRVHFSTKNSMVHVPRDDDEHEHDHDHEHDHHITSPLSSPSASVIADQIRDNILNYESIYSNEYEPIGSENNSSNLYVDMEAKLSPEERLNLENKPPKQPPALPPKPANLIKFKKAVKVSVPPLHFSVSEYEKHITAEERSVTSEPDYCSISEVNMTITSVQVVADVHKEPEPDSSTEIESLKSDTQSMKTDEIEEIFADIPKLPNVAAIIASRPPPPSKISNYLPQPRDMELVSKLQRSPRQFKRKHVPNVLAEINKRMNNPNPTTPTKGTNKIPNGILTMTTPPKKVATPITKQPPTSSPIIEDKSMPMQAEFDWYNLDVEYGKSSSNQPDIIRASDVNSIDENGDGLLGLHGVEYNLDEEFSLAGGNQPDIIKENHNESPKTINDISLKTVCEEFPVITEVVPCLKKIKKTANFDKFIDNSGLSTKPLPRQRKIYFAGPFV